MKCQGHKPTEADSSKKGVGSKKRGRGNGSSAKRASKVGVSAVYVAAVNGELTARAPGCPLRCLRISSCGGEGEAACTAHRRYAA